MLYAAGPESKESKTLLMSMEWCLKTADDTDLDPLLAARFKQVVGDPESNIGMYWTCVVVGVDLSTIVRDAKDLVRLREWARYNTKGAWAEGELRALDGVLGVLGSIAALSAQNRARVDELKRVVARCQVVIDGWIERVAAALAAREQNVETVTVGNQEWARYNVRETTNIVKAPDLYAFARLTASQKPAWIQSEDGSDVLYNRHVDFDNLCPGGFRVPTEQDWVTLEMYHDGHARRSGNGRTPAALAKAVVDALVKAPFAAILTGYVIEDPYDPDDPPSYVYDGLGHMGSWWGTGCIFSVYRDETWSFVSTLNSDGAEGNALRLIQV